MDIKLIAEVNIFTLFSTRNSDKKFTIFKERVFERDNYTCTYCSFKSKKFMQVINRDGNYLNNGIDNLVTACPFCAQCHFLPYVGKVACTGGVLIHLPDVSQLDLNAFCHVSFCLMRNHAANHKKAEKTYKQLKLRSKNIEEVWGKGLSNPAQLGQMLIDTPVDRINKVKSSLLSEVRLLPSYESFAKQINVWSQDALKQGITDPI